ncbi:hypothetical protein DAPPUDRAFT_331931 [Daphnia pulex]|uniref:Uncharacterized protein n=1 Tax=Daphnia pulex TaxID=6669 RepID=E9HNU5_DAPPU|nr:hypothetical protein DAPPUDRAFT_331931 [Daphnia pulex]|eukprot:EFX66561.1 hypothetical protein DAPPUDRAFT_331931 [Daphnia pulex]
MNANFNPGEKIQEYKDMIFYKQRERGGYGLNNARNKIWIKLIKFSFLDPTQPTTTTKDVTDEASTGSAIEINNVNSTNGDDVRFWRIFDRFPSFWGSTQDTRKNYLAAVPVFMQDTVHGS